MSDTTTTPGTTVVRNFLEAFSSGDVATALGLLGDDIRASEPAGLPTGGEYDGKQAFIGFLEKTGATYEVEIHGATVLDAGPYVLALVDVTWTSVATKASLRTEFCELYTVDGEQIASISVFPKDTRALYELTMPLIQ